MIVPSCAVTVTVRLFRPSTRPDLPVTTTAERASLAIASTATDEVRAGTVTRLPSRTAEPFTVNVFRETSDDNGVT